MSEAIMTIKEVAAYLKLNEKTTYRLASLRKEKFPDLKWDAHGVFSEVNLKNGLSNSVNLFQNKEIIFDKIRIMQKLA